MSQFAWTFPAGKLKQEVTSITVVNNVTFTEDVLVPAGKIWWLLGVKVVNPDDVDRVIAIYIYKETAKTNLVSRLLSETVAPTVSGFWPNTKSALSTRSAHPHRLLAAGNKISVVWTTGGASAGGTDADGLVLEYLEIDAP